MGSKRHIFVAVAMIYFILAFSSRVVASDLPYKEGELFVRFAPEPKSIVQRSTARRNQILASFNAGEVKHSFRRAQGLTLVKLPKNLKVTDALPKFRGRREILYAEPNYKIKFTSTFPDDTRFGEQWAMHNTGQGGGLPDADIDAPEAWDVITDSNVIVAVLDTGVYYDHNDLKANMWVNEAELNGDPNVDDDGNGFKDDIYGYDFGGDDPNYHDSDPNEDYGGPYGHGTHVTGIIGAIGNNSEGVTGVCWKTRIMAVKITPPNGGADAAFISNAIEGIEYAVDNGAKVINASWNIGGGYSQVLKDAIDDAGEAGVLFVVAAGNGDGAEGYNLDGGYPRYPQCYDSNNIICVMGTTNQDVRVSYSDYGPISVDLSASAGEDGSILSTVYGGGYGGMDGTSVAAPHVSGACAMVWAANPLLTHLEVKQAIVESVDELGSLTGLCVSEGRLNLYNAVTYYPLDIILTCTSDINDCIDQSSLINYSICYTISHSAEDVNIISYLSADVDYNSCTGGGLYDANLHAVYWPLGHLDANDTNCFTLTARVAQDVIAGHYIINTVKMYSGANFVKTAQEQTKICCYDTILYVAPDANGTGDGLSWQNAYAELHDALADIKTGEHPCIEQVWVAAGTYKPTNDANDSNATFEMLYGIDVYGHFAGDETSIDQRDLADANFATILTGDINGDGDGEVNNVVTAADSRLDGFTVKKGYSNLAMGTGILCNNCSPIFANCVIADNYHYGIYCQNGSNATITNTLITDNVYGVSGDGIDNTVTINIDECTIGPDNNYGLYAGQDCTINAKDTIFSGNDSYGIYVSTSNLAVERCSVNDNSGIGIYTSTSISSYVSAVITDSMIHNNNSHGIRLDAAGSLSCQIRNNTVADNTGFGIYKSGNAVADIRNNIIWNNTSGSLSGTFGNVNYNCVQGGFGSGIGNIASDPCFVDADANDYHLSDDSNCIEAGDPNFVPEAGETDIDREKRVMDGDRSGQARVDMGADEFYQVRADIYPQPPDGIVDFLDFAVFAKSWRTSQGQPDYNVLCDFNSDNVIDYKDLYIFCTDWLWITVSE